MWKHRKMAATNIFAPIIILILANFLYNKTPTNLNSVPKAVNNTQWSFVSCGKSQSYLNYEVNNRSTTQNERHRQKKNMASKLFSYKRLYGILLICGDILTNPGPTAQFKCGLCDINVEWKDQGLCCDDCGLWFHAKCQSAGSSTLIDLNTVEAMCHGIAARVIVQITPRCSLTIALACLMSLKSCQPPIHYLIKVLLHIAPSRLLHPPRVTTRASVTHSRRNLVQFVY